MMMIVVVDDDTYLVSDTTERPPIDARTDSSAQKHLGRNVILRSTA